MPAKYTERDFWDMALEEAAAGLDVRKGSIFHDSVAGCITVAGKLCTDVDINFERVFIDSATGEGLDKRVGERHLERNKAKPAKYHVAFVGAIPETGERFFTDGMYFVLKIADDGVLYLEAEVSGISANNIFAGTPAIPVNNISGLESATFGAIMEHGVPEESDDDLRTRFQEKIAGPAENGNRQHYKTWCEEDEGVGRARILPLWNGPNTVKGVLINPLGKPADDIVVARVQEYIDPDEDGDGEGDGLGEGVANLGAHFTATAAEAVHIAVAYDVQLASGYTREDVITQTQSAMTAYLKNLALDTPENESPVVRIAAIGAEINSLLAVIDYGNLTLNGETANVELTPIQVGVLSEVVVNVL